MDIEFTPEQNKKICERYPFLLPINVWTGEPITDYNYECVLGLDETPIGWKKLFLQMCEDIRQPLIDSNYINEFRLEQVKEKYGELRIYYNGANEEVNNIISKYEYISKFVCERCGKPATKYTNGWISEYCDDCIKSLKTEVKCTEIKRDLSFVTYRFCDEDTIREEHDCTDIWNRLFKEG